MKAELEMKIPNAAECCEKIKNHPALQWSQEDEKTARLLTQKISEAASLGFGEIIFVDLISSQIKQALESNGFKVFIQYYPCVWLYSLDREEFYDIRYAVQIQWSKDLPEPSLKENCFTTFAEARKRADELQKLSQEKAKIKREEREEIMEKISSPTTNTGCMSLVLGLIICEELIRQLL